MRVIVFSFVLIVFAIPGFAGSFSDHPGEPSADARHIYDQIGNETMSFEAFDLALRGWNELKDSIDLI
ncbi:MAG: hypothetical protein KAT31_07490, partial [Bacteroidales bacterium]|nr:hypothetical protein [Bacteroidales bacterium]